MRSRPARLFLSLFAILALAGVAALVGQTERQLTARQESLNQFDSLASDIIGTINEIRSSQQAYIAAGQNSGGWIAKNAEHLPSAAEMLGRLRTMASTESARQALLDASSSLAELTQIDRQARDYLAADQTLMAGDVIFSEGLETAAASSRLIDTARTADRDELAALELRGRRREASAAAAAAGFAGLLLLWFAASPQSQAAAVAQASEESPSSHTTITATAVPLEPQNLAGAEQIASAEVADVVAVALSDAARICTEFGRVQSADDLKRVLGLAAKAMDASGLIVWLGNAAGRDLQPVVAHGYSEQVLALMRPVPKHADNAAAAAYRAGALQIVPAKPGTSLGAVVAPIVSADGCIGALTAEVRHNNEVSDTVHAVASIVAAQLSGVLAASAQASPSAQAAAS